MLFLQHSQRKSHIFIEFWGHSISWYFYKVLILAIIDWKDYFKTIQMNHIFPFPLSDLIFFILLNDIWKKSIVESQINCIQVCFYWRRKRPFFLKLFQFYSVSTNVTRFFKVSCGVLWEFSVGYVMCTLRKRSLVNFYLLRLSEKCEQQLLNWWLVTGEYIAMFIL